MSLSLDPAVTDTRRIPYPDSWDWDLSKYISQVWGLGSGTPYNLT